MITQKEIREVERDLLIIFNEPIVHKMREDIERIHEAKTPEGRYRAELRRLQREYSDLTDEAIKRAGTFTRDIQNRISDILEGAPAFDADNLPRIRSQIELAMEEYEKRLSEQLHVLQSNSWENGLNLTDSTLEKAGITIGLPAPPVSQLAVAKDFSADLITNVTSQVLNKLNSEITLGVMTGRSVPDVMKEVKKVLTLTPPEVAGAGRQYSLNYRAEMIARTEMARVHDMANRARLDQANEIIPELKVQFLAEPDACEDCAQYADKIYDTADQAPAIPVHPNCRCTLIPYLEEFEK